MRIVLDTNVLISGLLSARGQPASILRLILSGLIDIVADERILLEYESVLKRPKFAAIRNEAEIVLKEIQFLVELIVPMPLRVKIPDPGDLPFIEVAKSAGVAAIVTGNKRHFPSGACGDIKIWNPRELLDNLAEETS